MTRGILLANLGTPDSADTSAVRRYLGEFLMDRHVIDLPWLARRLLVSLAILPFRPRRSAAAYGKIWDAAGAGTGSPLLYYSERCREALQARLTEPVALAMRYGRPDIDTAIRALTVAGANEILLVPMYPQHADSTRSTSIEAVRAALPDGVGLTVAPPFFANEPYLAAQAEVIRQDLPDQWDYLLLSYHGLPQRHLIKADPTGSHCLQSETCCQTQSPAHATCYRYQSLTTSARLAQHLNLPEDKVGVSFQSRLGRLPWMTPYTDQELQALPGRGVRRLVVACPAFVADNLETLEEIGMAGRRLFLDAGGEEFTLVPCLNDHPAWINALAELIAQTPPAIHA